MCCTFAQCGDHSGTHDARFAGSARPNNCDESALWTSVTKASDQPFDQTLAPVKVTRVVLSKGPQTLIWVDDVASRCLSCMLVDRGEQPVNEDGELR